MINLICLGLSGTKTVRVVLGTCGGTPMITDLLSDLLSVSLLNNHWEMDIPAHKSLLPF